MAASLCAIPCYNEELAIGSLIAQAKQHVDRVLVIDDGSADRTVDVAKLAGAEVVVQPENMGKGRAIQAAFRYAKEHDVDRLVLMDGDGQHDPEEIPLLLDPINAGSVNVALGFRFGQNTEMPGWRRAGKRVLDFATAAGGGGDVTDSQCGYRAYDRKAIEVMAMRLKATGFGVESEQLVVMKEHGLTGANVTIHCKYDNIDGSTKGPVEHAVGVLGSLISLVAFKHPLIYIGIPGVAFLVAAVGMAIFTLQQYNVTGLFSVGYALVTATIGLLGTVALLSAFMLNMIAIVERRVEQLTWR